MTQFAALTFDAANCVIAQGASEFSMAKSDDPHFRLRVPPELKADIEVEAARNNRSMNAEILWRLVRFDSLSGEANALYAVARTLADEIDAIVSPEVVPMPLADMIIGAVRSAVNARGEVDGMKLRDRFSSEVAQRIGEGVHPILPSGLLSRVQLAAATNMRPVSEEIVQALEEAYPAPAPFDLGATLTEIGNELATTMDVGEIEEIVSRGNARLAEGGSDWRLLVRENGEVTIVVNAVAT